MNWLLIIKSTITYIPDLILLGKKIMDMIKGDEALLTPTRKELLTTVKDANSFEELKRKLSRSN